MAIIIMLVSYRWLFITVSRDYHQPTAAGKVQQPAGELHQNSMPHWILSIAVQVRSSNFPSLAAAAGEGMLDGDQICFLVISCALVA